MRILGGSAFYDLMGLPGPKGDPGPAASWDAVTGKPEEFPPGAHEQEIDTIIGLRAALLDLANGPDIPADLNERLSGVEGARIIAADLLSGVIVLVRADGTTIALPATDYQPTIIAPIIGGFSVKNAGTIPQYDLVPTATGFKAQKVL